MRSKAPEATTGKIPGRMLASMTTNERKPAPMNAATNANSIGELVTRLEATKAETKPGDDKEAGETIMAWTADPAGGD